MRPLEYGLPEAGAYDDLNVIGIYLIDPSPSPFDLVEQEETAQRIDLALKHLSRRERRIIKARFGIDKEESTLQKVGRSEHLSKERIRQVQAEAIDRLRVLLKVA